MPELTLRETVPGLSAAQLLAARAAVVVDLRSPGEYGVDHVPGAVNAPLFDDVERALIGTLYKRVSPEAAFAEARSAAAARIDELVARIAVAAGWEVPAGELSGRVRAMTAGGIAALEGSLRLVPARPAPPDPVVLCCWRGGLRSRSVVALVRALGLDRAVALEGGYKRYRRAVLDGLARWDAPPAFVLRGLTGVGKTLVLRELERIRPGWTLDLEGLAGHRSSILGMVGLEPVTQKTFESRLFARQRAGFPGVVVMEGESRKVGDVILPRRTWEVLDGGADVELVAPVARRVDVLIEDYLARPANRAELRRQLPFIERRLGPVRWSGRLVALLDAGREGELVEVLLERYYDPLYRHSGRGRAPIARIDTSDVERAARETARVIEDRLARGA